MKLNKSYNFYSCIRRWDARVDRNLRHFALRKFPFSVVYASTTDLIYIVAVAHGSREPEYWRPRVQDR